MSPPLPGSLLCGSVCSHSLVLTCLDPAPLPAEDGTASRAQTGPYGKEGPFESTRTLIFIYYFISKLGGKWSYPLSYLSLAPEYFFYLLLQEGPQAAPRSFRSLPSHLLRATELAGTKWPTECVRMLWEIGWGRLFKSTLNWKGLLFQILAPGLGIAHPSCQACVSELSSSRYLLSQDLCLQ